jgi:hypothetical protein
MGLSFIAPIMILEINSFNPTPKGSKFLPDVSLGFSVHPSGIGVKTENQSNIVPWNKIYIVSKVSEVILLIKFIIS